jgi:hypothetical protein
MNLLDWEEDIKENSWIYDMKNCLLLLFDKIETDIGGTCSMYDGIKLYYKETRLEITK